MNITINPFALSTAQSAWQNEKNPPLTKVCQALGGAAYDFFIKNPFSLTVGNCRALMNSTNPVSTKIKIAVAATVIFGSLYTLMLYGAAFHLSGRCLSTLGSKTGLATLEKVGDVVKRFGTNVFVAGAVPIYSLFYALPKYIILSVPEFANSVITKISSVAKWLFQNVLQPLWANVIFPTMQTASNVFNFIATKIGVVLKAIGNTIETISKMIFNYVLTPLWEKALLPVLRGIGDSLHFIATIIDSALKTVGTKIIHVVQWIFQHVITPLWSHVVVPVIKGMGDGIVYLAKTLNHVISTVSQKMAQLAQLFFHNLIVPVWNGLVFPVLKTIGNGVNFIAKTLAKSIQTLAHATAKVASFIFQKMITPIFNGIVQLLQVTGNFLGKYVLKPLNNVLTIVAEKVGYVFKVIFDALIVPTARSAASLANVIKDSVVDLNNEIWRTVATWSQTIFRF